MIMGLLSLGAALVVAGEDMEKKEITLTGEVLDLYCYMQHPEDGQGADHAKCARSCINKSLPIGYMSDGVKALEIVSIKEAG